MRKAMFHYDVLKSVGVVALAASLPLHVHISSILIGTLVVLTLLKLVHDRRFPFEGITILSLGFVALFLLELIGLSYTEPSNLRLGFSTLEKHMSLVMIPFIFIDFFPTDQERGRILAGLVVTVVLASLVAVVSNVLISIEEYERFFHEWRFSHDRISEPIGLQAVYFSLIVSMAIVVVFNWFLEGRMGRWSAAGLGVLTVLLGLLSVALGARTITASLMLAIIVILFAQGRRFGFARMVLLGALVISFMVAFVWLNPVTRTRFMDLVNKSKEGSNYDSYLARTSIWGPGADAISENFWLGTGTGDGQSELDKKFIEHNYHEGVQLFNMHNEYLQLWLEIGLPGLVVFLFLLVTQWITAIRRRDATYAAFLVLFCLGCVTESMLSRNKGVVFFTLFSFVFFNFDASASGKKEGGISVEPQSRLHH